MTIDRPQKRNRSDLLTTSDVAEEVGWPVSRAGSLIRNLSQSGKIELHHIEGSDAHSSGGRSEDLIRKGPPP
jgi:hypothetical protein